jgi:hypothetical protein
MRENVLQASFSERREAAMRPNGATHEKFVKTTWDRQLS